MNWFLLATIAALLFVGYILWGVAKVIIIDRYSYARFWRRTAAAAVGGRAIRLVALGDSTFQGLGASRPLRGTVGRVAQYVEERTGRPVHIENVSVTGAKAVDVARVQLSAALKDADIIIVAVGANDALKLSGLTVFEQSMKKIVEALPDDRTIMADVALVRDREKYQAILDRYRHDRGLLRADLEEAFRVPKSRKRLSGKDFFHPSDYGYELWFAGFKPAVDKLIIARKLAK